MHKRCKKCKYMSKLHGGLEMCDYLLMTGRARRCEPGEKCDKYEQKKGGAGHAKSQDKKTKEKPS